MNTVCMPASSGPGRMSALDATRSSKRSHRMLRSMSVASARLELEDAGGAARRGACRRPRDRRAAARPGRGASPLRAAIISSASWITVSVLRPRKSILSMPTFSSAPMSYCVMIDVFAVGRGARALGGLRCRPARSRRAGPARSPRRRRAPTRGARAPRARSRSRAAAGSARRSRTSCRTSATFSIASVTVSEKFGWFGDELGELVGLGRGEAEHAADVLDRGARLHRAEGDDLAHATRGRTARARTRSPRRGARSRSRRRCPASTRARDSGSARTAGRT